MEKPNGDHPAGAAETKQDNSNLKAIAGANPLVAQALNQIQQNEGAYQMERLGLANRSSTGGKDTKRSRARRGCTAAFSYVKVVGQTLRSNLWVPVLVFILFGLMCGLGLWGVIAAADNEADKRRNTAIGAAQDAAKGFEIQLRETFIPMFTMDILVRQNPDWDHWNASFDSTAAELLGKVTNGSLWNIQLQPHGVNTRIHPYRTEDYDQIYPPKGPLDILQDPIRRAGALSIIRSRDIGVNGPLYLV
eukprot:CAMPEP_0202881924 /NCGR_PEP_ID=MMETSP1391-20130828/37244_1 /ASSEMBLY_ACC=CAM_ASM_000867 /TAXON_ID=1034604 /ORGANISM="Chlamydomonas leiostraca, Strain SAG 11-49" /LENGTH=247 /DNA_ID=CAMNT_0049564685 /DNA_START=54 /DNA_END=794 /DNA_ORIENTATION=+